VERALFILGALLIAFFVMWTISQFSKGKIKADLFSAINAFLYFGLFFNIYAVTTGETMSFVTLAVITGILLYRRKQYARWI